MSNYILIIITILSLTTLIKRFIKNPAGSLMNPLFLLLAFSLLYFSLPALYVEYALMVMRTEVTTNTIETARLYSITYISCFYIFYLLSKDRKFCLTNSSPSKITIGISKILWILISLFLIFIIIVYFPQIYTLRDSREMALQAYEILINMRFKLRIILYLHLCVIFVLFWKDKSLFWLLPCFLYLIIDYSHGGRTMSLLVILFSYFLLILKTEKHFLKFTIIVVFIMITSGLLQRTNADGSFFWYIYSSGLEFSNTYLTTVIYLDDMSIFEQSTSEYIIVSLSKVLPGGLVDKYLDFGEWYGNGLSDQLGFGFGLAGNLITEALIYGGKIWAFINPFVIGSFMLTLNRSNIHKNLWGFFYLLIICITMQNIVRSYFYGFALYPIQIIVFLLFWTSTELRKKIFE